MNILTRSHPVTFLISSFWFVFWLLNALDKVFARTDLGFIFWWGNARTEKFTMYFERLNISPDFVTPTLLFAGIVELLAAIPFAMVMVRLLRAKTEVLPTFVLGTGASILIFIGFCGFDVVVGDRAELLEHSTYVGVLLAGYLAVSVEFLIADFQKNERRRPFTEPAPSN